MELNLYQALFIGFVSLVCLGLLVDACRTGGIWAKGGREGEPGAAWNAHKITRQESPAEYWFHAVFYAFGALLPLVVFLF
ncbi:hypothetical protein [Hydrogenophaga sp. 5NK40-0174]|uniref:hypothetical protein n=1 Tax=Hydrogenophaga sp. 5NK40-0174 TaxID=3127649 RepID=UPI0031032839